MPSRYQVTILVHSPGVGRCSSSPTSALSSVDLPAFTLPAIATRSGSSRRSRSASSDAAVRRCRRYTRTASWSRPRTSSSSGGRRDITGRRCREQRPAPDREVRGCGPALPRRRPSAAHGSTRQLGPLAALCTRRSSSDRALRPRGELVAELALDVVNRVAGVLADLEGELVGVLAMGVLRLTAPLRERVLLVAVRLSAEQQTRHDADGVDQRQPDHLAEHAEHEDASVRAAQRVHARPEAASRFELDVGRRRHGLQHLCRVRDVEL